MEFLGFANSDFDFFKKKSTTNKEDYDNKKEEVRRHFREYCYEIQKNYHSLTGGAILFEKDFQGLNKSKNYISAFSKISDMDYIDLIIDLSQNEISIGLVSIQGEDLSQYKKLKELIAVKSDVFHKFYKENKSMHAVLYTKGYKKAADDVWTEDIKYENNELSISGLQGLIDNISNLEISSNKKRIPVVFMGMRFLKSDAIKIGKSLASKSCGEIVKLLNLCDLIKHT